jgi:hypothetical protein
MKVATKVNLVRLTIAFCAIGIFGIFIFAPAGKQTVQPERASRLTVQRAVRHDQSKPLATATIGESEDALRDVKPFALAPEEDEEEQTQRPTPTPTPQFKPVTPASAGRRAKVTRYKASGQTSRKLRRPWLWI